MLKGTERIKITSNCPEIEVEKLTIYNKIYEKKHKMSEAQHHTNNNCTYMHYHLFKTLKTLAKIQCNNSTNKIILKTFWNKIGQQGNIKYLDKSNLFKRYLKVLVLGADTRLHGREFQIFTIRQEKEFFRVLCLVRGTERRNG